MIGAGRRIRGGEAQPGTDSRSSDMVMVGSLRLCSVDESGARPSSNTAARTSSLPQNHRVASSTWRAPRRVAPRAYRSHMRVEGRVFADSPGTSHIHDIVSES